MRLQKLSLIMEKSFIDLAGFAIISIGSLSFGAGSALILILGYSNTYIVEATRFLRK